MNKIQKMDIVIGMINENYIETGKILTVNEIYQIISGFGIEEGDISNYLVANENIHELLVTSKLSHMSSIIKKCEKDFHYFEVLPQTYKDSIGKFCVNLHLNIDYKKAGNEKLVKIIKYILRNEIPVRGLLALDVTNESLELSFSAMNEDYAKVRDYIVTYCSNSMLETSPFIYEEHGVGQVFSTVDTAFKYNESVATYLNHFYTVKKSPVVGITGFLNYLKDEMLMRSRFESEHKYERIDPIIQGISKIKSNPIISHNR